LAVYASRGRGIPSAIEFLRKVLDSCEGKPVIVVDRGPWYRWALDRLGITCFHETFHNNVNSKTLKSIEEIATAVAIVHNLVRIGRGEVIPT
jgi:transposase-like protein